MPRQKRIDLQKRFDMTEALAGLERSHDYIITKEELLEALSYYTNPKPPRHTKIKTPMNKRKGLAVQSKSYIKELVQKCILRHDWSAAVCVLKILLDANLMKIDLPFLLETVVTVLQNHPESSPEMLQNFERAISSVAGQPFNKLCKRPECEEDEVCHVEGTNSSSE